MQIYANQLENHLRRGLAPVYVVHGEEWLLVEECCAAIRAAAQAAGFLQQEVLTVESGFDWNRLTVSIRSPSLFAVRRVLELRLPTGRPGETGAKTLVELARQLPPDVLLLVRSPRFDRQAQSAGWIQALERIGVVVVVLPLEAAQLPGWIAARLRRHGLKAGAEVVELLAYHLEGNLLAAAQEIEKLALVHDGEITLDDIEGALCDNARFNVYALADACLKGELNTAFRILRSLRAEGTELALLSWALSRELRGLAQMAWKLAGKMPLAQVLDTHKVWAKRKPFFSAALARAGAAYWQSLLQHAAYLDRLIKGRAAGEPWRALERLVAAFAAGAIPGLRVELHGE